jgi:hypothetical protein
MENGAESQQPLYNKTVKLMKKVWPALEQPHRKGELQLDGNKVSRVEPTLLDKNYSCNS